MLSLTSGRFGEAANSEPLKGGNDPPFFIFGYFAPIASRPEFQSLSEASEPAPTRLEWSVAGT